MIVAGPQPRPLWDADAVDPQQRRPGHGDLTDRAASLGVWRRRHVARFGVIGGTLVIALLVELLILNQRAGRGWSWAPVILLVVLPAVLLLVTAAVSRRIQSKGRSRELMETASPSQVRQVTKALRRHEILPDESRAVAQTIVNLNANHRGGRGRSILLIVAGVLFLANFFIQTDRSRWFYLVGAIAYVALALQVRRGNPRLLANAAAQGIHPTSSSDDATAPVR